MTASFAQSEKLCAPALPSGWLPRARLADLAFRPLVLLEAGPGAGKTLAMAAMTEGDGQAVAWVTLEPGDGEAQALMRLIVLALQAHVPPLADDLAGLLAGAGVEARTLVQALVATLAAYNPPRLTLVIDDAHHALDGDPSLLKALVGTVERYPPGFRLLLATRRRWPFPLGKALASERAVRLDARRLAFDDEEVAAFLAERAPTADVPEAWLRAAARLEGWPLGLALLARRSEGEAAGWNGPPAAQEALQAYVAEELLAHVPEAQGQLLLQLAGLQTASVEACRWIFQVPDAERLLADLAAGHLLQPLSDGASYRVPPHLREALGAEAARRLPAIAHSVWHRRAAAWFRDQGMEEAAIPHLLAVRDWDGAAVSCGLSFTAMSVGGRRAEIDRLLEAFPPEAFRDHPLLMLWRGHGRARRGDLSAAMADYAGAREGFAAHHEPGLAFKALVRECTLTGVQGDLAGFGRLLIQAQALSGHGEPADLADFHLARALAAEQRGDLALVSECNEAVLTFPAGDDRELASCQGIARLNLFGSALDQGDLEAARAHVEEARALALRHGFHGQALYARFLLAHLHLLVGETEAATDLCSRLPAFWCETLDFVERGVAWTVLGHHAQVRGDWREAEQRLRRAVETFRAGSFPEGLKVAAERQMWLAIGRGQPERALACHAEVGEGKRGSLRDLALRLPLARARQLAGESAAACGLLRETLPALEAMGARLHHAHGLLLLAAACLTAGQASEALAAYEQALAMMAQSGYAFLLTQDPGLATELQALASPAAGATLPDALQEPDGAASRVAPLSVRCLGTFEVRLGGVSLASGLRKKAKLILAVLAAHPRGLPIEEIAERLGVVELTPGNVRTLQADMSELRRVLEPGLQKGKDSRYVQLTENRYHLVAAQVELVDVWAFERAAAAGDRLRDRSPAEAVTHYEEALALFRGNLLDEGGFLKHFAAERESFKRQALAILGWLARHHEAAGAAVAAEDAWKRAITLSPVDEDLYLALMRVLHRRGEAERARHVYWECRKAFKLKLGDVPSREFESASQALIRA